MAANDSRAAVIGDGAWGSALAMLLNGNGLEVSLWSAFPENLKDIARDGENRKFLPGVPFPSSIRLDPDISKAIDGSSIIVLATPSQYMRNSLNALKPHLKTDSQILVNVSKGIETSSLKRMSQLCDEVFGDCLYCVLSGPSHAEEVSRKTPTAVVVASSDINAASRVQDAFMNSSFRVYTGSDVVGVELGGSLKNVLAIAAGMVDGMGFGDNTKAALMTRGVAEMARLGEALGGQSQTFSGLSGVGDLIVTCMSRHSRNRHVGEELGKGCSLKEIADEMGMTVAEGVKTSQSACDLARQSSVETPIVNEVRAVIYDGKNPKEALFELMTRKAKHED